jgi:hypothetical protein
LWEVRFEDLKAFLKERRPENESLDYKSEWDVRVAKHVCAIANTSGGNDIKRSRCSVSPTR